MSWKAVKGRVSKGVVWLQIPCSPSGKCSLFIGSEKSLTILKERNVTIILLFSPLADE